MVTIKLNNHAANISCMVAIDSTNIAAYIINCKEQRVYTVTG